MGPLSVRDATIEDEEEPHRRIEQLEVARHMAKARRLVLSRDAERAVHVLGEREAPRAQRFPEVRWIDRELVVVGERWRAHRLERHAHHGIAFVARHGDDLPRLDITARRCPTRRVEHLS